MAKLVGNTHITFINLKGEEIVEPWRNLRLLQRISSDGDGWLVGSFQGKYEQCDKAEYEEILILLDTLCGAMN